MCAAVVMIAALDSSVHVASSLEERKLPMKFSWKTDNQSKGWIAATGIVTSETYRLFEEFAKTHDAIKLGRRWRELKVSTTVGIPVEMAASRTAVLPEAYCESMCVFLLLAGVNRYVPPTSHIRVHQIWMGDRAEDAKAATYTAQDVSIIERDVGRLAKYTFDMGGTGDLLEIALSVPPWKALRELTVDELRRSNLVSTEVLADVLPGVDSAPVLAIGKPVMERFAGEPQKTAEVKAPATVNTDSR
jgi:hypothetical protein